MRWIDRLPWRRRDKPDRPDGEPASAEATSGDEWVPGTEAEQEKGHADALADAGRLGEACAAYRQLLERHPRYGRAWNNFGLCLRQTGRIEEARQALEQAVGQTPTLVPAWVNLASLQEESGEPAAALESLDRALVLDPASRDAHNNAGQLLAAQGRYCAAEERYRRGLAAHPEDVALHFNLGLALARQGRIEEAIVELRDAAERDPATPSTASGYLLALNYAAGLDPRWVRREHERLVQQWPELPSGTTRARATTQSRPLRVGYVSADFGFHVVSFFIEPVLAAHDRRRVQPFCYFTGSHEDAQCERLKATGVHWRSVGGRDESEILALMRADELDVAIDLSGHTEGHALRVLAARVAPVQMTWLGYPNTTGVRAIDYCLTDAIADPPGMTDAFHSETLCRLEGSFLVYRPRPEAPAIHVPPATTLGRVTFGSFNNFAKVSDASLALWAGVLGRVPDSRLLIKSKGLDEPGLATAVRQRFEAWGGDASRLVLEGHQPGLEGHLARYAAVDIALDTTPYAGTTTTCEALWMGVPVITLAGSVHASRVGASLLTHVGHPEWVARSEDEYAEIAARLAGDAPLLERLRHGLRDEMRDSPLTDAAGFTRSLEAVLERMVVAAGSGDPRPAAT